MTEWYYATADGQRHGPLADAQLRALADAGTIDPQTLVWREGLAQWRPLHEFAVELGLGQLPPPLPAAPGTPPGAPPGMYAAPQPQPRPGMSGCLIAVLVAVAGLVVLSVLGILAAIALPAYQDYRLRSISMAAIAEARSHQPAVAEFMAAHDGRCPSNDDEGFGEAESYAGPQLSAVVFGEFEGSDLCGLEATISAPGQEQLDGQAIWLEHDPDQDVWTCTSEVADRHLPEFCRG